MNILVTICARGGSKGVPGKNIRVIAGKPLIAHTIDYAAKWGRATDIIVSTDDLEIAKIAEGHGALVPFTRPIHLSADDTPKIPVIRHALRAMEELSKKQYQIVVDLDATAPVRGQYDLDNCLKLFMDKSPDSLFSVVKARKNPYFNMVELDASGRAHLSKKTSSTNVRRQDAPNVFEMNASIYFYKRDYIMNENTKMAYGDNSIIYEMDENSRYDIDSEEDFKIVELILKENMV